MKEIAVHVQWVRVLETLDSFQRLWPDYGKRDKRQSGIFELSSVILIFFLLHFILLLFFFF